MQTLRQFSKIIEYHTGLVTLLALLVVFLCRQLDFLVDFTKGFPYIAGARMMGGGFGGCTINLIQKDKVEEFISMAAEAYMKKYRIQLEAIPVLPAEGTHLIRK